MRATSPLTADELAFIEEMGRQGYAYIRKAESGEWIALTRMLTTIALCVGLSPFWGYRTRFCYPFEYGFDAIQAVAHWDGRGDPPGRWIKQKGGVVERCNPLHCEGCYLEGCARQKKRGL